MKRLTLLLLIVLLVVPGASLADSWKLRAAYENGSSQRYALSQNQSIDFNMGGTSQKMENGSRIEMTQTVKKKKGDAFLLNVVYDRMESRMSVGGMVMAFDSASKEDPEHPMARLQDYLIGKPYSMTVSSRGEITEIDGFDTMMDGLAESFADDPALAQTLAALRQGFNDEAMSSLMQQSWVVFPEKAVSIGDGWKHDASLLNPAFGEMKLASNYVVEGAEKVNGRDCVKLVVSTKIDVDSEGRIFSQLKQLLGTEAEVEIREATASGTILVEGGTGLVVDSKLEQRISMEMSMRLPGSDAAAQPMALTAAVIQNTRMELLQ